MKPRTRTLVPALLACALFALSPAADAQKAPKPPAPAAKPVPVAAKAEVAAAPAKQAAPKLELEKYVLDNGLEVILDEDHRTPVVAVNVWYHVGSKDEAPGKNGFAHLFEHVMFQGSRHVAEDTFFKYLERAGASERNGTTNTDRTNYWRPSPPTSSRSRSGSRATAWRSCSTTRARKRSRASARW